MNHRILFRLLALILILSFGALGHSQNFDWVNDIGPSVKGKSVAIDMSGNMYTIGSYTRSADFDPGPGATMLSGIGNSDIFLTKSDPEGKLLWAYSIHSQRSEKGYAIDIDPHGDILIAGEFKDSLDIDPGTGRVMLKAPGGGRNTFVAKYTTQGKFLWATQVNGGLNGNNPTNIKCDKQGNVYVTGTFMDRISYFNGRRNVSLNTNGSADIFILALDKDGKHQWLKRVGGSSADYSTGLDVDHNGNLLYTGYFSAGIDIDPGGGFYPLNGDPNGGGQTYFFISKLDSIGNFVWAQRTYPLINGTPYNQQGKDLVVDALGNAYVTGSYQGEIDFDPGTDTMILRSSVFATSMFVSRYNSDGTWAWSKHAGGVSECQPGAITIDQSGHLYITGNFEDSVDFNISQGITQHVSNGSSDIFVQKLDIYGNYLSSSALGGSDWDEGLDIAITGNDKIIVLGMYSDTVDFNPSPDKIALKTAPRNQLNVFTLMLNQDACADFGIGVVNKQDISCKSQAYIQVKGLGNSAPFSYQWTGTGDTTASIRTSQKGLHKLIVTNAIGCKDSTSFLITGPSTISGSDWRVIHVSPVFRPGFTEPVWIDAMNSGCQTEDNELYFIMDKKLRLTTANLLPQRQSGDTLFWHFNDMDYSSGRKLIQAFFTLDISAPLGDTVLLKSMFDTTPEESNPGNNSFTTNEIIIGSYDPNDIQARPRGFCERGIIHPDSTLQYLIRFQNTGTASAVDVIIEDELDPNLDFSTLNVLSYSHQPMKFRLNSSSLLEFTFPNIQLPDSNTNEPLSHGYILFEIKPKKGLSMGTKITNTARIFFDYNDPIITNTTLHTMYSGHITDLVTVSGNRLEAHQLDASYQWINCNDNSDIRGVTSRDMTVTRDGVYGVRLNLLGCEFRSDCYGVNIAVNIDPDDFAESVSLSPNPTTGKISLELPERLSTASLAAYNTAGALVGQSYFSNVQELDYELVGPSGLYLLRLDTEKGTAWFKVVKE